MKKSFAVLALASVFISSNAFAALIVDEVFLDTYTGPAGPSQTEDVVGGTEYQLDGMKVTLDDSNVLEVTLISGATNYFGQWKDTNGVEFGPGSLFLNTAGSYSSWNYALTLDGISMRPVYPPTVPASGTAQLYNIASDGGTIVPGQIRTEESSVFYAPKGASVASNPTGWQFFTDSGLTHLRLSITLPDDFVSAITSSGALSLQWSQLCANDIVRGTVAVPVSAVPEPATMALFGFGLLGLAGLIRRK